jgi:hypothetical protein
MSDEALINFSNHHTYQDRLITFPGPGGRPVVSHVVIKQELGMDGQEESCAQEVQKVVELVLEHARRNSDETLGVITMGIRHMNRVQGALDQALEDHADLSAFFDTSRSERFFVKNLERVQGDEHDACRTSNDMPPQLPPPAALFVSNNASHIAFSLTLMSKSVES